MADHSLQSARESLVFVTLRGFIPCLVACLIASVVATRAASAEITEAGRLSAIYDTILRARFEQAGREIAQACPPAPREACRVLDTAVLWWRILLDPDSQQLDAQLRSASQAAIDAAEAWTRREPKRAEAWFYLAGAYGPLVQLRALRGERVAAARDGNRIRSVLEKAIALDPQLHDAYFGIGLYHYYADVMPAAAKLLRMLLFLPGGDKAKGMQEMLQARDRGVLVAGEADFQLHWLYVWYEHAPAKAIELLKGLDARYPSNPVFLQRVAEISRDDLRDHQASADAWRSLLARTRAGQMAEAATADARARIGLARELIDLSQPAEAIEQLTAVANAHPRAPYSAESLAHYYLGVAHARLGQRESAIASFNRAIAIAPADDRVNVRARSREQLQRLR
jgi:tetratricopeptide (TPR) repeat protein